MLVSALSECKCSCSRYLSSMCCKCRPGTDRIFVRSHIIVTACHVSHNFDAHFLSRVHIRSKLRFRRRDETIPHGITYPHIATPSCFVPTIHSIIRLFGTATRPLPSRPPHHHQLSGILTHILQDNCIHKINNSNCISKLHLQQSYWPSSSAHTVLLVSLTLCATANYIKAYTLILPPHHTSFLVTRIMSMVRALCCALHARPAHTRDV